MTPNTGREAVTAQAIEWALRDKPFESAYLRKEVTPEIASDTCKTILGTLRADRWIRFYDDAWYPGVRAVLVRAFDFPTPDTSGCIDAVGAARDRIVERSGASDDAINEVLSPLTDYMVGINGPDMLRVGAKDLYRTWLRENVVDPGLRTLPEIEPPSTGGALWTVGEIDAEYRVLRVR